MSTIKVDRFENTAGVGYGTVVQVANFQTGTYATGSTSIPYDDTIPQNTEGTQFMSLTFTPKSATNKLKITIVAWHSTAGTTTTTTALFQDSIVGALAAVSQTMGSADWPYPVNFTHYMTAGTTSSTTFKIRIGNDTSIACYFNGSAGVRKLGGIAASSITIEEIQV